MEKAAWGKEQEIFTVEIVDRDPQCPINWYRQ